MRIHMVGIGGISMRALARYLVDAGHEVSGCDVNSLTKIGYPDDPAQVAVRAALGLPIIHGHDARHVDHCDQVLINSAITETHPGWIEVTAARRLGIPVLKRAQKIGELTRERPTIAITGTHGKSTTTGMVAKILLAAGLDPFVMIGAPVPEFNRQTYRMGSGPLVLEADEFDRSFLNFSVAMAVITTIEADHLDYYTGGLPEIIETFAAFMGRVIPQGTVIVNADDAHVMAALRRAQPTLKGRTILRYGRGEGMDLTIVSPPLTPHRNDYAIVWPDQTKRLPLNLAVPGRYNQENATAAVAVAEQLGLTLTTIAPALMNYRGVGWRFETLVETATAQLIIDYGHHPTEIRVTLDAAKDWFGGQPIQCIFQPHQYVRTQLLFPEFVDALLHADRVWVTDIYGVAGREGGEHISAEALVRALVERGADATYLPVSQLVASVYGQMTQGGIYLMIGAGLDIRDAALAVAEQFKGR